MSALSVPPQPPRSWRRLSDLLPAGQAGAGDVSLLPVACALALTWVTFTLLNGNFASPENLSNLALQIAATGTIAIGVVLVLLIGEIDLSVGAVSGFAAGVMAVLNVRSGLPGPVAIGAGVATGAAIGLLNGLWVTRTGVPAFVVTLAGLLAWQGALLAVLGDTGSLNLSDPAITSLAQDFLPAAGGWALLVGAVAVVAAGTARTRRRRAALGLAVDPWSRTALKFGAIAGAGAIAVAVLNADRGVPLALVILLALVAGTDQIVRRTTLGRHIMAVGGNAEAARRTGVPVDRVRVIVFTAAGALAALGGIIAASRLFAVNQSSGAGDLLLNAIAAAVIGGTSLFGGRGTVWAALLGALVIGSISNGMDLLGLVTSAKFMITGAVLLLAVTVDARTRRGET